MKPTKEAETILHKHLQKLEDMIDLDWIEQAKNTCRKAFDWQPVDELPYVFSDTSNASDQTWKTYEYNDLFFDPVKMLQTELSQPYLHHQLRDYHPVNVRCNYGTPILATILGANYRLTETSLPWTTHVESRDDVRRIVDHGIPDIRTSLGGYCFSTAEYYLEILRQYPKLKKGVTIYHPDLQGPFDIAHLIWGHDIFVGLFDEPDLVHQLCQLITDTYIVFMQEWKKLVGEGNEFTTHWNFYIKGGIMLRDDSAVMVNQQHYEEFIKPYDEILLDKFNGCIHFCGNGNKFIQAMAQSDHLYGIHMSQPELNNVNRYMKTLNDRKILALGLAENYVPEGMNTGVIVLR